MKLSLTTLFLTVSTVSAVALPKGASHHDKHHQEKRDIVTVTEYVTAGAAEYVSTVSAASTTTTLAPTEATEATATASSPSSTTESSSSSSGIDGDLSNFSNPTKKFEDGTIKCSSFPSGQGVIALDWLDLDGWSSIADSNGKSVSSCSDGHYCSYACQAGMSKTQWPSDQPDNGQTVGGLYCKDGYLYRSNTDTDYLCAWDTDSATVENQSSNGAVAMCRTDYPGDENMVIPTYVKEGSSKPISVVDESTYFKWQGKETSSQYYVNNAGVSVEDGCVWGSSGSGVGNWAPLIVGAGYTNGKTYLSLVPNPNNGDAANFNVKIVATDGSSINGDCYYEDGSFSSSDGCTVTVTSGSATIVFY
ncbi:hypothetical protein KAFR_0D02770 [Kazachstania africana CBS 2517]|uniref:Uncharacterized protein n=1 Tax=Kazachstania africana (strain ATCC 22294 / BCRC 22015 / CBS 2517 / CECT 1963 / NBRC 1671 / NRRL Y-8276) TaxID=1071382 RepID=H2AU75_KAZAF|nr:hypothetical protein KAFR_0D02770 [Kazachstania africana CBS 2517]CCF57925.1 hypothetical protein KAFR_0D02770 [Kazachstania africana CBS 2517]